MYVNCQTVCWCVSACVCMCVFISLREPVCKTACVLCVCVCVCLCNISPSSRCARTVHQKYCFLKVEDSHLIKRLGSRVRSVVNHKHKSARFESVKYLASLSYVIELAYKLKTVKVYLDIVTC